MNCSSLLVSLCCMYNVHFPFFVLILFVLKDLNSVDQTTFVGTVKSAFLVLMFTVKNMMIVSHSGCRPRKGQILVIPYCQSYRVHPIELWKRRCSVCMLEKLIHCWQRNMWNGIFLLRAVLCFKADYTIKCETRNIFGR